MDKIKKPRPKVYAVDFDGTIVENAFPRIGKLKPKIYEKQYERFPKPLV